MFRRRRQAVGSLDFRFFSVLFAKTTCQTALVATNPSTSLNELHPSERIGTGRVYDVRTRPARRPLPREVIQSVTESHTATAATGPYLVLEAMVTVELNRTLSIMDKLARFKPDILADRLKVPNRHTVLYTFPSSKK
ncbi:hypothetical protein V3C99_006768 [Haemonchus contortus]